jgi:hypothetical protein
MAIYPNTFTRNTYKQHAWIMNELTTCSHESNTYIILTIVILWHLEDILLISKKKCTSGRMNMKEYLVTGT